MIVGEALRVNQEKVKFADAGMALGLQPRQQPDASPKRRRRRAKPSMIEPLEAIIAERKRAGEKPLAGIVGALRALGEPAERYQTLISQMTKHYRDRFPGSTPLQILRELEK
jgi:hypothetical protein